MALRGTASQGNTTSSSTVVINVSGIGIQNGDVVLLYGIFGGGGTQTITWPSGFGAVSGCGNQNVNAGTMACSWKIASSEPTSYTITAGVNDFHAAHCRVYSGRNSTQFSATSLTTPVTGSSFPISFSETGLTAVAGDDLALVLCLDNIGAADTLTYTPPSGFGNSGQAYGNVTFAPAILFCDKQNVTAGSTGTLGGSCSDTNGGGADYGAYLIAIAASASGAPLLMGQTLL
jgi:hypothetical protein